MFVSAKFLLFVLIFIFMHIVVLFILGLLIGHCHFGDNFSTRLVLPTFSFVFLFFVLIWKGFVPLLAVHILVKAFTLRLCSLFILIWKGFVPLLAVHILMTVFTLRLCSSFILIWKGFVPLLAVHILMTGFTSRGFVPHLFCSLSCYVSCAGHMYMPAVVRGFVPRVNCCS